MKGKLNLHKLSPKAQANIKDGLLLATAGAGAYGIFGLLGTKLFSRQEIENQADIIPLVDEEESFEVQFEESEIEGCVVIESNVEVVESNDEESFTKAFSNARAELGPGGFFNYNGKSYTTFYKEELDELPKEDIEELSNQIGTELADGQVIDVINEETREVIQIASLEDEDIDLLDVPTSTEIEIDQDIELIENELELPEEIVYDEDFNDPLFDGTGLTDDSSLASSSGEDIVISFEEFDDPLFDGISTTESSNSTIDAIVDDTETVDGSITYNEDLILSSQDLASDFNDPLFSDSFETMESTPVYEPIAYTEQDLQEVGLSSDTEVIDSIDLDNSTEIDDLSDLGPLTDDIIE